MSFKALMLEEADGKVTQTWKELEDGDLPEGEVTIRVAYSDLNYKDGLILKGLARLVRDYPHIPGIDLSGTVEASTSPAWQEGDDVVVTGWAVGERHWGGYTQKQRVKAAMPVKLPGGIDLKRAMALGTAGFTAMLAVIALERHGITPDRGEVLVTGAAGGLGSVAVALLAKLGYQVAASTGRPATHDYLKSLGATAIVDRAELSEPSNRPLEKARWAAAIDTVGGVTLARAFASIETHGSIAVCGNAGGNDLATTVLPLILRGVNLLGIDSNFCPSDLRTEAWTRLASDMPMDKLDAMTEVIAFAELPAKGEAILKGKVRGRCVVDVNA
ncbi:MAG TPA: MDR family oxidoreductase [Alphaproteobacteria bacterium]|nr:MDR family oxidoreductase [Alphaproteobacteria bacterium]